MAGAHDSEKPPRIEVGVRELRRDLSRWLDAAQEGRDVVVTDRGRPVARLVGISKESALDRLVAAGAVRMPLVPRRSSGSLVRVKAADSVADLVRDQRR